MKFILNFVKNYIKKWINIKLYKIKLKILYNNKNKYKIIKKLNK